MTDTQQAEPSEHSTKGSYVTSGEEFTRDTQYIETRITRDAADGYPVEAGRYRLIAARACPWANRAIIVRRLLGLEDAISLGTPSGRTSTAKEPRISTRNTSARRSTP